MGGVGFGWEAHPSEVDEVAGDDPHARELVDGARGLLPVERVAVGLGGDRLDEVVRRPLDLPLRHVPQEEDARLDELVLLDEPVGLVVERLQHAQPLDLVGLVREELQQPVHLVQHHLLGRTRARTQGSSSSVGSGRCGQG